jgi:nitrate reductase gamma subunit
MDFFSVGLTLACLGCLLGLAWRGRGWFSRRLPASTEKREAPRGHGLRSFTAGLADVFLLRRTLRTGKLRWAGHPLLLLGFLPLLLLHSMDGVVTRPLFPGYEPTLEPWQSARNILGLAALTGLGLLVWHRAARLRALSRFQDWALPALLAAILVSGFGLEAAKIASPADFERMADDYFPEAEKDEYLALQSWWAHEHGVRFERFLPVAPEILEQGRELHEDRCAGCHAPTATAFASRALADALPAAVVPPRTLPPVFWHVHVGLSFLALALLPWGKFLHPLASTANLLARGGRRRSDPAPATISRNLALEACTRCGQCSLHCSVAPSRRVLGNPDILPMDKLEDLRGWLDGRLDGPRWPNWSKAATSAPRACAARRSAPRASTCRTSGCPPRRLCPRPAAPAWTGRCASARPASGPGTWPPAAWAGSGRAAPDWPTAPSPSGAACSARPARASARWWPSARTRPETWTSRPSRS